jgi:NAD(P)-dependent dehydrogenase (short-subunit alcohol dehydrogenase family)
LRVGRLDGKRIVVTGAGSGIGRASAELFEAEGARVLAVDLSETVVGTRATICVTANAADEASVAAFVRQCVEEFGGIDGIYANAGIGGARTPLFEMTPEQWRRTLEVNLIAPFLAVKHAAPYMIHQGGGAILCTASVAGIRANAGGVDYSASKAGVVSLVQTVAHQLYGTGVRINAICPGLIETGMTRPLFDRARERGTEDRIGQLNPLRRPGQPVEIARMAAFLLSDEASYVDGQAVAVDGGLSSSHPFVYPARP